MALAALCLAIGAGPTWTIAQTSAETHKDAKRDHARDHDQEHKKKAKTADPDAADRHRREAAAKHERTQAQQRDTAARQQRQAAERRGREQWERQDIVRRQNAMRDADNERAAARKRQDARWDDEMQRRDSDRKGAQPASRGPYSLPGAYGTPVPSTAPRTSASSGAACSAQPTCPADNGYGNVCRGVSRNYADSGAAATGMQDIVSRCRSANLPDPCNTKYHLTFGGGCAQQCASVARCTAAAVR